MQRASPTHLYTHYIPYPRYVPGVTPTLYHGVGECLHLLAVLNPLRAALKCPFPFSMQRLRATLHNRLKNMFLCKETYTLVKLAPLWHF